MNQILQCPHCKHDKIHQIETQLYCREEEKDEVLKEAREILDVKDVIASIILVDDLRIQKN